MKYVIVSLILLSAVILEASLIQLPLVLLSILLLGVLLKEQWIFFAAFLAGMLLDIAAFRTVGVSSLFFVGFLGVVFLYERKFEIQSMPFVTVSTLIGSSLYFFLFGSSVILLQILVSIAISAGVFFLFQNMVRDTSSLRKSLF